MTKSERRERIKSQQDRFNKDLDHILLGLTNIPLAMRVAQNSWLFAGCQQDLEKARARIMNYIEKVLK